MRRSSLPRAPEPDVRVRVRRSVVQIGSERAGVRTVDLARPPKQRATALLVVWSLTDRHATCR